MPSATGSVQPTCSFGVFSTSTRHMRQAACSDSLRNSRTTGSRCRSAARLRSAARPSRPRSALSVDSQLYRFRHICLRPPPVASSGHSARCFSKSSRELFDNGDGRHRRRIAQRAESPAQHVLRKLAQQRDVVLAPAAFVESAAESSQPGGAFAARDAPAAALMRVKPHDAQRERTMSVVSSITTMPPDPSMLPTLARVS